MGHERIGLLPKSRKWTLIVDDIGRSSLDQSLIPQIANSVLNNVKGRFSQFHRDAGVQSAFGFLLALTLSGRPVGRPTRRIPNIDLEPNPSPLALALELQRWVNSQNGSREYAALATAAASDAIAWWTAKSIEQANLFSNEKDAAEVWVSSSTPAAFCEISRTFTARLTERYLNYFLEREASAQLTTLEQREEFSRSLREHVDRVSAHAFETAKIAQSFAAGWYANYVVKNPANDIHLRKFLARAFAKIQEELVREQN